ncbi:MAG TPA: hypothetical protein VF173_28685 [Thermoanaerobaculia bacterium]|nr:hypothetical protein [Thermoanaerobaculia bacterium]
MTKSLIAITSLALLLPATASYGAECSAVTKPTRAKIMPTAKNPQYFHYNGSTQVLVGASAEYLCHVRQPDSFGNPPLTPAQDYCEFTNYPSYIDNLRSSSTAANTIPSDGLNVMQMWISLDSSPGFDRGKGRPYDHEAPFPNNCAAWPAACSSPVWNLNAFDQTFFDRLKCVLDYAWSKDLIVEITIFDPWQGNFQNSPWHNAFTHRACFASKDYTDSTGTRCDASSTNVNGWARQRALIQQLSQQLCGYPNIYYEIANEVDLTGVEDTGQPALTPSQILSWHQDMAGTLATSELSCGHYIGANFHDPSTLSTIGGSSFSVVNAHYTSITGARFGANELIRTRDNGDANQLNVIFGFNETKLTSDPALFGNPLPNTFQTATAARAEAWEFVTSEGGVYDLYGERWQSMTSDTVPAIGYLKLAHGFVSSYNLNRVHRSPSAGVTPPAWVVGVASYGSSNTYWGAMESDMTQVGDGNFLYIHHSSLNTATFQRYNPLPGSYGPEHLFVKLPVGSYLAEWVLLSNGSIAVRMPFSVTVANQATSIPASPGYSFDIALRITRQ